MSNLCGSRLIIAPWPDVSSECRKFPCPPELEHRLATPKHFRLVGCREIRWHQDGHTSGDFFTSLTISMDFVHRRRRSKCYKFPVSSTSEICWDRPSTYDLGCREVDCSAYCHSLVSRCLTMSHIRESSSCQVNWCISVIVWQVLMADRFSDTLRSRSCHLDGCNNTKQ